MSRPSVLTSGYNKVNGPDGKVVPDQSGQFIFIYDLNNKAARLVQTLRVDNAFYGLAWRPDSQGFYVSGGVDDKVYAFAAKGTGFTQTAAIKLGHAAGNGAKVKPQTGGLAVSGRTAPLGRQLLQRLGQPDRRDDR